MLAYVFWHWQQPSVDGGSYKNHLLDFHRTLASNKPIGFHQSTVFTIKHAPWLETKGEAYEEWYLLDDSAALDPLNGAAVSGACEEPHNRVAREAAGGAAGLYLLRHGPADLNNSRFAVWLSKPAGVSYGNFYSSLQRFTSSEGTGLWGRQMVLGPTQEFCLHSPDQIDLPPNFAGQKIPLHKIWP
jgi:hypothetical protein